MAKIKRYLTDVNFDADWCHIALTAGEGAASLMNEAYVFKGLDDVKHPLNDEELDIVSKIGEDHIVKSIDTNTQIEGIIEDVKKENDMSEEIVKELTEKLEAMEKQLAVEKAERAIMTFKLEGADAVAKALATLADEDQAVIIKAFTDLKSVSDQKVSEKAVNADENPVVKALADEAGEGGEEEAEKSFAQRVKDAAASV